MNDGRNKAINENGTNNQNGGRNQAINGATNKGLYVLSYYIKDSFMLQFSNSLIATFALHLHGVTIKQ